MIAKPLSIVMRVDSGRKIGTGHLMRCLTLANALRERGHTIEFMCRDQEGSLHHRPMTLGYKVHLLPRATVIKTAYPAGNMMHADFLSVSQQTDLRESLQFKVTTTADVVVVDHYGLDSEWEGGLLAGGAGKLVVIDDLADRNHVCSALIDQNYYKDFDIRYDRLIPSNTIKLLGPDYAMVRPQFLQKRTNYFNLDRHAATRPIRLLISFGGADHSGYGLMVCQVLLAMSDVSTTLMGGCGGPDHEKVLTALIDKYPTRFSYVGFTEAPWDVMVECDLYIGAGGSITWERCVLGLPGIIYAISTNQVRMAEDLASVGAQVYLGSIGDFDSEKLTAQIRLLEADDGVRLKQITNTCAKIVDGLGLGRLVRVIENLGS